MKKPSILMLFSVVFMDMVGFAFIIPIMPDIVSSYGGSEIILGIVLAAYALGQFFGAPIVGSLSDRFGRKPLLMLSIFGTMCSLLVLGFARSIPIIIASRLIDGLTGGNITVAQSYISDITSEEDRAKGLGLIGMAFGLGFIFGPLFGGLFSLISLQAPAFVAAGMAALNLVLISFRLPESLPKTARNHFGKVKLFNFSIFKSKISGSQLTRFLFMLFFYSMAWTLFESMFTPHAQLALGLNPLTRGLAFAFIGVLLAGIQGGLIGILTKKFSDQLLLRFSVVFVALSMVGWAFTSNLLQLLLVMIPLSLGAAVQGVVMRSRITKEAKSSPGAALGMAASIESFNRILGPIFGGFLLSRLGAWGPGIIGACILIIPFILIYTWKFVKTADSPGGKIEAKESQVSA
jgi:DHA1 family tetracycline resistance protein-like MFS transporter